jgi:hypothetical protein
MTGDELILLIHNRQMNHLEVVVEVRVKTGYDEGDIYEQTIEDISINSHGKAEVKLGTCKHVGGW